MTSNILTNMKIPFEYYTNGYSNILAVDKIPDYVIMHQSTEEYEKNNLGKGDVYYRDIKIMDRYIMSSPPSG